MFKPFFVHFSRPVRLTDSKTTNHRPRGFTAYIQPSELPRHVQVQMTFCSSMDQFMKHEGRSRALDAQIEAINVRDVAKILSLATHACGRQWARSEQEYFYIFKYVV